MRRKIKSKDLDDIELSPVNVCVCVCVCFYENDTKTKNWASTTATRFAFP